MSYSSRYSLYAPRNSDLNTRRDSTSASMLNATRRDPASSRYADLGSRYTTTSRYGTRDYSSKSLDCNLKMSDEPKLDEPKELVYGAPVEEETPEVLQESDVEDFKAEVVEEDQEEAQEEEKAEAQVHETVYVEQEEEEVATPEPEPEAEPEIVLEREQSFVDEPASPVAAPANSPPPATRRSFVPDSQNENCEPDITNPKKLNDGVWPPREETAGQSRPVDDAPMKKKVSDLIARFNMGKIENENTGRVDSKYKSEYGATENVGKVGKSEVFQ